MKEYVVFFQRNVGFFFKMLLYEVMLNFDSVSLLWVHLASTVVLLEAPTLQHVHVVLSPLNKRHASHK